MKGTTVIIFIYAIHHDENVYPNAEKFDPDRFVQSSLISDKQSPFVFIPFSAGSRNCIGMFRKLKQVRRIEFYSFELRSTFCFT